MNRTFLESNIGNNKFESLRRAVKREKTTEESRRLNRKSGRNKKKEQTTACFRPRIS